MEQDNQQLVKRLRAYSGRTIHAEAADRIEKLEAQLAKKDKLFIALYGEWIAYLQEALEEVGDEAN